MKGQPRLGAHAVAPSFGRLTQGAGALWAVGQKRALCVLLWHGVVEVSHRKDEQSSPGLRPKKSESSLSFGWVSHKKSSLSLSPSLDLIIRYRLSENVFPGCEASPRKKRQLSWKGGSQRG